VDWIWFVSNWRLSSHKPEVTLIIKTPVHMTLRCHDLLEMSLDLSPFSSHWVVLTHISGENLSPVIDTDSSVVTDVNLHKSLSGGDIKHLIAIDSGDLHQSTVSSRGPYMSFVSNGNVGESGILDRGPGSTFWLVSSDSIESVEGSGLTDGPDVTSESARGLN
jgi:hypothetical protein